MSVGTIAFVFNGVSDWKKSTPDDWDLSTIEIDGTEKVLGHKKIDAAILKVIKTNDGQIVAIVTS